MDGGPYRSLFAFRTPPRFVRVLEYQAVAVPLAVANLVHEM